MACFFEHGNPHKTLKFHSFVFFLQNIENVTPKSNSRFLSQNSLRSGSGQPMLGPMRGLTALSSALTICAVMGVAAMEGEIVQTFLS